MNTNEYAYYVYLLLLFTCWMTTLQAFRRRPAALKVFSLLIGLTFITECLAYLLAFIYRNNLAVYHVFSLPQLLLLIQYFHFSAEPLHRSRKFVYGLSTASMAFYIFNTCAWQPVNRINSNFLYFESILIIALCLYSFRNLFAAGDDMHLKHNPYLWININLLLFWSATFLEWGLYDYLEAVAPSEVWKINLAVLIANYLSLTGIILTFCLIPPQTTNEHP